MPGRSACRRRGRWRARHLARQRVAGIGHGVAAKHVAGKLVEHDGERQRAVIARFPGRQFAGRRLCHRPDSAGALRIERVVAPVPAVGPASRQNARISAGVSRASVMIGRSRVASGRGLLLVAQFAAQDLADIGLGQVGPELDLLGDLVGGELRAAELDDVLGVRFGSFLTMKALTASPDLASWTPITAHSSTPGWLAITSSISFG